MRTLFIQRIEPLSVEYKRRFPKMRKLIFVPEGSIVIDDEKMLEEELLRKIYDFFGEGEYQILGFRKKGFRFAFLDNFKPFTKLSPFYCLGQVAVNSDGTGKVIINRRLRYIIQRESW